MLPTFLLLGCRFAAVSHPRQLCVAFAPAVPFAIGGAGLPDDVKLKEGMPEAGLGNVAATLFELMGYAVRTAGTAGAAAAAAACSLQQADGCGAVVA
jgi:hypothetical protein